MSDPALVEVSVVLPCYKAEPHLANIAAALQRQTLAESVEIIFVNDGGGAAQLEILQLLQRNSTNIRIIDQQNGGVSAARNAGLDAATGKWVAFIDPDDVLEPHYLQSLHSAGVSCGADIVVGGFSQDWRKEQRTVEYAIAPTQAGETISRQAAFERLAHIPYVVVWNKLFRREPLVRHALRFSPGMSTFEDESFFYSVLMNSNPRICLIGNCGYRYQMLDKESANSRYHANYGNCRRDAASLKRQLIESFSWDEKKKRMYLDEDAYLLGYFICCNWFKRGSPLSLWQQRARISAELLGDADLMRAARHALPAKNPFLKIYDVCMRTRSAWVLALSFRLQYWAKYHMYGLYLVVLPYLRGTKSE